jgi:NADH-quinone oxidoreductase subunit L
MRVGPFQVEAGLALDRLAAVMCLIVTGVGSLIHLYSTGYMRDDPGYARYFSYLNLFLAAMLILVLADNLLLMFVGWEGVGLCSYLLIGFWFEDPQKAYAGKKAFIVNRIGDFGFLIGIFLLVAALLPRGGEAVPLLNFGYLQGHAAQLETLAPLIALFLFIGAVGKSAQIPLYVWLPDAMAGPTPVSALIHAATMVTAGVYMIARLNFLYALAPQTLELVAWVGGITSIFAAMIALVQNDIKKVLAYSTISQLGYMFLAMGVGAFTAGIFHLMTHAFFKACLFLGAGSVIHAMHHEQDIRRMGGLRKAMPLTAIAFVLATLAIAGIPPFAGFFSKDEILWETFRSGHRPLWLLGLVTAGFTSFYMFRLLILVFFGASRASEKAKAHLHESPWNMSSVLLILGLLSVVGGFVGIPHVLGGHNWFHGWLHLGGEGLEGETGAKSVELILMATSVGVALAGALVAWLFYLKFPEAPKGLARALSGLYRVLADKFYVDEIYDAGIVRPIRRVSESFLAGVVDERLIDGAMVNGSGRMAARIGGWVSRLQGGLVNSYAFYFLLALCGIFFAMVIW